MTNFGCGSWGLWSYGFVRALVVLGFEMKGFWASDGVGFCGSDGVGFSVTEMFFSDML